MFVCCLVNLMFFVIAPLGYLQAHYARVNPMPEGYKHIQLAERCKVPGNPGLTGNHRNKYHPFPVTGANAGWRGRFAVKRRCAGANIPMKECSYCGAEYPDDAVMCAIDHAPFERPSEPPPPPEPKRPEYDFAPFSEAGRQKNLVTLLACRTFGEADMDVGRLQTAGIEAFLPDESLMWVIGWNLNTYRYVRVQISPKD